MSSGVEAAADTASQDTGPRRAWQVDTLLLCAAALILGWQPGTGFMALLTLFAVAPWLLYQGAMAAWRPARRRAFRIKLAAIAATAGTLWILHAAYASAARQTADEARDAVMHYHATHGTWPANLEAAGFHDLARVRHWRIHYADIFDGAVMYQSSFNAFDKWWRRPDEADWVFFPD